MSPSTNVAGSTALRQSGMLFNLPRELRDEIYRYLVKGIYLVRRKGLHLDILRVSKVIGHEAMAVLYSESTFRINVLFQRDEAISLASREAVGRMMNIELNVTVGMQVPYEDHVLAQSPCLRCLNRMQQIWKATLSCINRTDTIRNILCIRFRICTLTVEMAIPKWMYRRLKVLTRFRTVIVELSPEFQTRIINEGPCKETDEWEDTLKSLRSKTKAIKKHLGRALGPAVIGQVHYPGHLQYAQTLEFHPQKHMSAILRGRAKSLRAEADRLDLKADRAETGV